MLNDAVRSELFTENENLQNYNDVNSFLAKCKDILNRMPPFKQKHIKANSNPFISKTILKAKMNWTRQKNKFNKYWCERNKKAYNAQKNLFVSLVRKAKKEITLIILMTEMSMIPKRFGKRWSYILQIKEWIMIK